MWLALLTWTTALGSWPLAPKAQAAEMQQLTGAVWQLVAVEPADGPPLRPIDSAVPTLTFQDDVDEEGRRQLRGFGGCNQFFGSYVAGPGRALTIPSPIGATRMACPPAIDEVERALFQALESVESYERDDDELRIRYEKGLLRFTASPEGERRGRGE